MQAKKSHLSTFQIIIIASTSIRPITADIMMDARMAFGVYLNSGVRTSRTINTMKDITMFETALQQPAM